MKPEEIMVGDWIMFPNSIEKVQEVSFVEGKGYCASFAASSTLFPILIDLLKPIPITPEILEKNGFTTDDDDIYRWTNAIEDIVRLYTDDNHTWFVDLSSDICGVIDYLAINSIHELQHALRLCKIDKEIEL